MKYILHDKYPDEDKSGCIRGLSGQEEDNGRFYIGVTGKVVNVSNESIKAVTKL